MVSRGSFTHCRADRIAAGFASRNGVGGKLLQRALGERTIKTRKLLMKKNRAPFEEKYAALATDWNVSDEIVSYIVRRYTKLLEKELKTLESDEFRLPGYFRDRRSPEEYLYDLVDGWLIEDIVCDAWLRSRLQERVPTAKVRHMGTNRDRTIQKSQPRNISTDPDFVFLIEEQERAVELQMARALLKTGYDMKVSKVQQALKRDSCFLWVLLPTAQYFVVRPSVDLANIEPMANPAWGGKMVYRVSLEMVSEMGLGNLRDPLSDGALRRLGALA
jgi:hypothetical protein